MDRRFSLLIRALILVLLLSVNLIAADPLQEGYNYYLSGIKAYTSGNYKTSEIYLEKALITSPEIESLYSDLKLYLGLSYFQNQKYQKAYNMLKLYPNNAQAQNALKTINKKQLSQEISLEDYKISKEPTQTEKKEGPSFPIFQFILIFGLVTVLSVGSAVGVFVLLSKMGFGMGGTVKKKAAKTEEEVEETAAVPNVIPIAIEEVVNLKLDNVEAIWKKSKSLRALLGEIENETPGNEINLEEYEKDLNDKSNTLQSMLSTESEQPEKKVNIDATLNLDDLEALLSDIDEDTEISSKKETPKEARQVQQKEEPKFIPEPEKIEIPLEAENENEKEFEESSSSSASQPKDSDSEFDELSKELDDMDNLIHSLSSEPSQIQETNEPVFMKETPKESKNEMSQESIEDIISQLQMPEITEEAKTEDTINITENIKIPVAVPNNLDEIDAAIEAELKAAEVTSEAPAKEEVKIETNEEITLEEEKQTQKEAEVPPVEEKKFEKEQLDNIDKIKPVDSLRVKFMEIIKDNEKKLFRPATSDLTIPETIDSIEKENSKSGSVKYSKPQLEKMFTALFFEQSIEDKGLTK